MKISILVPNLSQNVLSRAHLLGKMLMRHYEVEIVGPVLDGGIWEPLADDMSVPRRALPVRGAVHLRTHLLTLGEMADRDVCMQHTHLDEFRRPFRARDMIKRF